MTADRRQGHYWSLRVGGEEDTGAILRLVREVHGDAYLDLDEPYWAWRYLSAGIQIQIRPCAAKRSDP